MKTLHQYWLKLALVMIASLNILACSTITLPIQASKVPPKPPAIHKPVGVALVLGGGGARGYAHLGALKVLQDAHVPIDLIVGSSAGSIFGALFADSGSVDQVQQQLMPIDFWTVANIGTSPNFQGVITSHKFQYFLYTHMRAHFFRELKIPLIVVSTDLKKAKPVVIRSGFIPPAIAASSAVPGMVVPVRLYGRTLIDGAVTNPIPVNVAKKFHPKLIIAINIAQDLTHSVPPSAIGIYSRAYDIMYWQLNRDSARDADVRIHPNVGQVSVFDFSQKQKMMLAGEVAAKKALPKIKRLMRERSIMPG